MMMYFEQKSYGIRQDRNDSNPLEWPSIVEQTAVSSCTTSTVQSLLKHLTVGGTSSLSRQAHMIRRTSPLLCLAIRLMLKRISDRFAFSSLVYGGVAHHEDFSGDTEACDDMVPI